MPRLQRAMCFVALMFAVTACSSGGGDVVASNPTAALAATARRTTDAGSAKMSFKATLSGGGLSIASGDGAYDFKHNRGRFKLTVVLGSTIDIVLTPEKLYVKQPKKNPGDKGWVGVTQAELTKAGSGAGFLAQLQGQIDPRSTLRNLASSVKDVHKVGTEKLRGAETTHLAGTVDLTEQAIAAAPKDAQAGLRQARSAVGSDGYPIDVWLDHRGRARRIQYAISVGAGAGVATTTVRLDVFGFGDDAGVVIPNASDVKEGLD